MLSPTALQSAAALLWSSWQDNRRLDALPADCRPRDRAEGYAIQAHWASQANATVAGWKIAATSSAGQQHIGVSGPLAGPVFAHRMYPPGAKVSLAANRMRVAECEIAFSMGLTLAPRAAAYSLDEVLQAIAKVHPAIELPDSRFTQFEQAGEAQLIADCACTHEFLLGPGVAADDRLRTLASHHIVARVSDGRELTGVGSNVLGDPLAAMTWLVNELSAAGFSLEQGQFVTTGACVPPIPVVPGDSVHADYGWIGAMDVAFQP